MRQSPPTDRVVRLLDLLAREPRERFTLSELARRLEISKATCLGIVGSLAGAAYVVREPVGKTYGPGPALLALGRAAQESVAALELVRPELQRLSERFGYPCTAASVVEDEIVVLDRVGSPGEIDSAIRVGERYPYAPPSGAVFVVWQTEEAIERWLADYPPVPLDRERLSALAASSRRLGYFVERLTDVSIDSYTELAGLTTRNVTARVIAALQDLVVAFPTRYFLADEMRAAETLPVSLVCSPTYTVHGTPEILLAMLVAREATPVEVDEWGRALRDAAGVVTAELGGVNPWDPPAS